VKCRRRKPDQAPRSSAEPSFACEGREAKPSRSECKFARRYRTTSIFADASAGEKAAHQSIKIQSDSNNESALWLLDFVEDFGKFYAITHGT
jgi:hypothetical protein